MSHSNDFAPNSNCGPGTRSAAPVSNSRTLRDHGADRDRGRTPCRAPGNLASEKDIDEQIRSFFERGLV